MPFDPSLYFIADSSLLSGDPSKIISQVLRAGITMLQLREKSLSNSEWKAYAEPLMTLARTARVPVIINDRVDIALLLNADGVHLGQDDMPIEAARRILGPDRIIGVSTHTVEEAVLAEKQGADYIGVGTVFPTSSKANIRGLLGVDGLRKVCSAVTIPVVAIGGISADNVAAVMKAGVQGAAVISAIGQSDDPEKSAAELIRMIKRR